jgi:hypothetical protein
VSVASNLKKHMTNKNNIFLLFFLLFLYSCNFVLKDEVEVKSSEIVIYYNGLEQELVILDSGKHKIPKGVLLYSYSVKDTLFQKNLQIQTKDGETKAYGVDYWYSIKPEKIEEFHKRNGNKTVEDYILPFVFSKTRNSFINYDFEEIEISEIESEIENELKNDTIYSQFIKTKSFKLGKTILDRERKTTGNIGS